MPFYGCLSYCSIVLIFSNHAAVLGQSTCPSTFCLAPFRTLVFLFRFSSLHVVFSIMRLEGSTSHPHTHLVIGGFIFSTLSMV